MNNRRANQFFRTCAAFLLALAFVGSVQASENVAAAHQYFMRGQIIEASDDVVVLCIGSADGIQSGQELKVIRHRRVNTGPKGMGRFERDEVGVIRVDAIVDDHYAEGRVISGKATQHDTVELQKR